MTISELFKVLRGYDLKTIIEYSLSELTYNLPQRVLKKSYSQTGEDLIIEQALKGVARGFYIDIGANDPERFSNTKHFYDKGWTGINIEPDVIKAEILSRARPHDITLNIGVSDTSGELTFYKFVPNTLSTFSKKTADELLAVNRRLEATYPVKVMTLAEVINQYCPNKQIDFLSIDTEGFDENVLKGIDWSKTKPTVICVEGTDSNKLVESFGYTLFGQTKMNSIFVSDSKH